MRRLAFLALAAVAAVAFSPGLGIFLALIVLVAMTSGLPLTWPKSNLLTSLTDDRLTGHGHTHLRADGLGAGGRHGPPRTIAVLVVLAVWALILATWCRLEHAVTKLATSAGHRLAKTNPSAQPLPS